MTGDDTYTDGTKRRSRFYPYHQMVYLGVFGVIALFLAFSVAFTMVELTPIVWNHIIGALLGLVLIVVIRHV